jgi:hypothetical protein
MGVILHDQIILDRLLCDSKGGIPRTPLGSVVIPVSILKLLGRHLKTDYWGVHPRGGPVAGQLKL